MDADPKPWLKRVSFREDTVTCSIGKVGQMVLVEGRWLPLRPLVAGVEGGGGLLLLRGGGRGRRGRGQLVQAARVTRAQQRRLRTCGPTRTYLTVFHTAFEEEQKLSTLKLLIYLIIGIDFVVQHNLCEA